MKRRARIKLSARLAVGLTKASTKAKR